MAFHDISSKLTHFKTPAVTFNKFIKIDSFQDPSSKVYGKNVRNWLLSRLLVFYIETWLISWPYAVNYMSKSFKLTLFKTLTLDHIVFSISMGDYLQIDSIKISMRDLPSNNQFFPNHPYTVKVRVLSTPIKRWHIICSEWTHFKTIWKRNGTIEHTHRTVFMTSGLLSRPQYIGSV